jgi:hypothetical protein
MKRYAATPGLSVDFDDFLRAPIGEGSNGIRLSVLSAFARLGMDPWQEAARLSGLPTEAAVTQLSSCTASRSAWASGTLDGTAAAKRAGHPPSAGHDTRYHTRYRTRDLVGRGGSHCVVSALHGFCAAYAGCGWRCAATRKRPAQRRAASRRPGPHRHRTQATLSAVLLIHIKGGVSQRSRLAA